MGARGNKPCSSSDVNLVKLSCLVFAVTVLVSGALLFTISPKGQNVITDLTDQLFDGRTPIAKLVAKLRIENAELREALAQKDAILRKIAGKDDNNGGIVPMAEPVANVSIDLMNFMGAHTYFNGISWDPFVCYPSPKTTWGADLDPDSAKKIEERLVKDLSTLLAEILKLPAGKLNTSAPYFEAELKPKGFYEYKDPTDPYRRLIGDPKFVEWRERIPVILSKYLTFANKTMYITCDGVNAETEVTPTRLGAEPFCSEKMSAKDIVLKMGYFGVPWESPKDIASGFMSNGMCTAQVRKHHTSFANWIAEERMYSPQWYTFPVETFEQDAVVFLFDILYEKLMIFQRQYWLGTIVMQNPFDMYVIQDIIFTIKPDLIIETGTANGGSALLWSSILELCGLNTSRMLTIDVDAPTWSKDEYRWGGVVREDPTKHHLWEKHVTFMKGSSLDAKVIEGVKAVAAPAKKVMVLLDSSHHNLHVLEEMEHYCPLVSVGSFCIIEDTKMSRWSSDGPLKSVLKFLEKHPEFEMDRSREMLYTHHAMGYLRRKH